MQKATLHTYTDSYLRRKRLSRYLLSLWLCTELLETFLPGYVSIFASLHSWIERRDSEPSLSLSLYVCMHAGRAVLPYPPLQPSTPRPLNSLKIFSLSVSLEYFLTFDVAVYLIYLRLGILGRWTGRLKTDRQIKTEIAQSDRHRDQR